VGRLEECSYIFFSFAAKVYDCAGKYVGPSARVRYRSVWACNCANLCFVLINVLASYAVTTINFCIWLFVSLCSLNCVICYYVDLSSFVNRGTLAASLDPLL
jgi:hypothetical protein